MFDPVSELRKRGVFVRLVAVSGGHIVQAVEDGRQRHALERMAHERWMQETLTKYNGLIMYQLKMAEGEAGHRSVQWLIAHGYMEVRGGKYVKVRK